MKLREKSKKSLGLNLLSRLTAVVLCLVVPFSSMAEPVIGGIGIPPGSFTHVQEVDILDKLGLSPSAWCYDDDANALLITSASRERARCELELQYELERQKTKFDFELEKLKIRINTLTIQHDEIIAVKDKELDRLSEAVQKVPNEYNAWWAIGGATAGSLITVAIILLVNQK